MKILLISSITGNGWEFIEQVKCQDKLHFYIKFVQVGQWIGMERGSLNIQPIKNMLIFIQYTFVWTSIIGIWGNSDKLTWCEFFISNIISYI